MLYYTHLTHFWFIYLFNFINVVKFKLKGSFKKMCGNGEAKNREIVAYLNLELIKNMKKIIRNAQKSSLNSSISCRITHLQCLYMKI